MVDYFLKRGWLVHTCGRGKNATSPVLPAGVIFETVDVANDAEVAVWAAKVHAVGQPPDLLLNNAAIIAPTAKLWELSASQVDSVIDVNLKGVINMIRHFVPPMIRRGSGVIVNFSSGWGRSVSPGVATYCATKWGIEGLTAALASELPPGLAAVALNPGIICTDMLRECFGKDAEAYPTPQEWIRQAGPFLESLSSKDNGKSLTVPGGL
jgi:NAD(P)-dependent dehydrogenase (short-subunit alcohol dehydrogenase family)